jgi:prepilin-type N-terminal cleavage/methylation domain-containing protein
VKGREPFSPPIVRGTPRGFTLLEILLVLAVISVIISVTWPPLMRYVGQQDLKESAVGVRHELAGARIKAIENGLVYQFRYEPGGRWYAILPYDRPDVGNAESGATGSSLNPPQAKPAPVALRQLPERCRFRVKPSQPVEQIPPEWRQLLPQNAPLGQIQWCSPILFFLDGTADTATVIIEDQRGHSQTLALRGVTGAVEIGPLQYGAPK